MRQRDAERRNPDATAAGGSSTPSTRPSAHRQNIILMDSPSNWSRENIVKRNGATGSSVATASRSTGKITLTVDRPKLSPEDIEKLEDAKSALGVAE
jgi:hypothetical protein